MAAGIDQSFQIFAAHWLFSERMYDTVPGMGTGELDQLDEALDTLAHFDVDSASDAELDAVTIELMRTRHRLAAATAGVLARWDARGVWRDDGSRSAATPWRVTAACR
jgi:hypothetical protein